MPFMWTIETCLQDALSLQTSVRKPREHKLYYSPITDSMWGRVGRSWVIRKKSEHPAGRLKSKKCVGVESTGAQTWQKESAWQWMCLTKGQKIETASGWEAGSTGNMTVERGLAQVGRHHSNPSKRLVGVSRLTSGVGGHDIWEEC